MYNFMCVFLSIMCSEKLLIIEKNCKSVLKIVSQFLAHRYKID